MFATLIVDGYFRSKGKSEIRNGYKQSEWSGFQKQLMCSALWSNQLTELELTEKVFSSTVEKSRSIDQLSDCGKITLKIIQECEINSSYLTWKATNIIWKSANWEWIKPESNNPAIRKSQAPIRSLRTKPNLYVIFHDLVVHCEISLRSSFFMFYKPQPSFQTLGNVILPAHLALMQNEENTQLNCQPKTRF